MLLKEVKHRKTLGRFLVGKRIYLRKSGCSRMQSNISTNIWSRTLPVTVSIKKLLKYLRKILRGKKVSEMVKWATYNYFFGTSYVPGSVASKVLPKHTKIPGIHDEYRVFSNFSGHFEKTQFPILGHRLEFSGRSFLCLFRNRTSCFPAFGSVAFAAALYGTRISFSACVRMVEISLWCSNKKTLNVLSQFVLWLFILRPQSDIIL